MIKSNFAVRLAEKLLETVSKDTGIPTKDLKRLYYGETKHLSLDVLDRLCEYFDCQVTDIIEYTHNENREGCRDAASIQADRTCENI